MKKIIQPYERKVQYYETDQMAIVHHSNYIRWFEEARIDFLEQIGLPYEVMEEKGILNPVLSMNCTYKSAVKFGDNVQVHLKMTYFSGIKFRISYTVTGIENEILHATGESEHCFVNKQMVPLRMKKEFPKIYEIFSFYVEE